MLNNVITITKDNFNVEVINSNKPVLLDFWATWCGPCLMVSPIIDEIAKEVSTIKVGKINVDEQVLLAQRFAIQSIPTLLFINNGKVVNQLIGVHSKSDILNMIK